MMVLSRLPKEFVKWSSELQRWIILLVKLWVRCSRTSWMLSILNKPLMSGINSTYLKLSVLLFNGRKERSLHLILT